MARLDRFPSPPIRPGIPHEPLRAYAHLFPASEDRARQALDEAIARADQERAAD